MAEFFASGRVADVILAVLAVELCLFTLYRQMTGRGIPLLRLVPTILSGAFLALALRTALTGAGWTWTGLALTGALGAHLWDLASRR